MDYTLDQEYTFYVRKNANSDWAHAGTATAHHPQAYLTFGAPVGPWGPSSNPRECWSRVLKDACEWMPDTGYGAGEQLQAKKRLAHMAYWSGTKDYNGSQSHYLYDPEDSVLRFHLWDLIHPSQ